MALDAHCSLLGSEPSAHRHTDVFVRLDRWPLYTLITGATTVITTFAVFFARDMQRDFKHEGNFVLPTISRTGGQPPTSPVFTLGLHLASFQSMVVFGAIYYRTRSLTRYAPAKAAEAAAKIRLWNPRLAALGLICVVGMLGTGSFYLSLDHVGHGVFASILFLAGMLYCVVHTLCIARPALQIASAASAAPTEVAGEQYWLKYKVWVCVLAMVACLLYVVVLNLWQAHDNCEGENWCAVRNWRSSVEYVLCGSLFLYIGGLRHDLRGAVLKLDILESST